MRLIPEYARERTIDWPAVGWHSFVHVYGVAGGMYMFFAFNAYTAALFLCVWFFCHLAIRLGAHSLYTHQAYKASYAWHAWNVFWFGLTGQGSLRMWAALHITHHKYPDSPKDPYSPCGGYWLWAHMLWTCYSLPMSMTEYVREAMWLFRKPKTAEDKKIQSLFIWQEKYVWWLTIGGGIIVPGCVPMLWGDYVGGFFVAGLRLLVQYHTTWQINSLSHSLGPQPYGSADSSRDSPWWMLWVPSILSVGEASRHNRHHHFASDFRIGNRWYDMDIGKWVLYSVWAVSRLWTWAGVPPLVWDLRRFDDDGTLRLLK